MGFFAFAFLAVLEIALAVRTCRRKPDRKTRRRERLIVRAVEIGVLALCLVCSTQKWRFIPALAFLAVLLVIAALLMLLGRRREGGSKRSGAVVSCVLSILAFGLALVPSFLFTGYSGLPVSGVYTVKETSAILIDSARTDPFEQDGSFREVPVHFYYPADAAEGETFPLVIFSHGAFGYYQSNTSTYMELASNGYVVASLDHPHHAFFTQDTDGRMILADRDFINAVMSLSAETEAQEQLALYSQWMALRTADMGFVLDTLEAAAQAGTTDASWVLSDEDAETVQAVLRMTDISRIGLMGHSLGGATAVELGRERGDIAAVVDIDGTMLGEYRGVEDGQLLVGEEPYTVPVLEFNNWETYNDRREYLAQGKRYPNDELMKHAADGFAVTVRETLHMDFTDLPLFSPTLGKLLGSGARSTEETMGIVNSLVLSFFDCYLKGQGIFTVQETY